MNLNFISDYTGLIAFLMIGGFIVWKFIIQPIQNEGRPIEEIETGQQDLYQDKTSFSG